MTSNTDNKALIARLRKMSVCVHIAVEASVAEDLADGLRKAAAALEASDHALAEMKSLVALSEQQLAAMHGLSVNLYRDEAMLSYSGLRRLIVTAARSTHNQERAEAAEAAFATARVDALEEAAQVCDAEVSVALFEAGERKGLSTASPYQKAAVWLEQAAAGIRELKQSGARAPDGVDAPIDMLLFCPKCGRQHIDAPDADSSVESSGHETAWTNPPHRSHLCKFCGHIWRPADVATNGVAVIKTRGEKDGSAAPARRSKI